MLSEIHTPEDAGRVAARVCESIAEPIDVGGSTLYITCSIGISNFPNDGEDVTSLLKHADAAMYHAKASGRNQYQFYTKAINARVLERMALENNIRQAIEHSEFSVVYQPKVRTDTEEVVGFEALMRWHSPELGVVSPTRFIPIAEDNGLIVPLGEWVLRVACTQAAEWRAQGLGDIRMAVNVSPVQFKSRRLKSTIVDILDETGLAPAVT